MTTTEADLAVGARVPDLELKDTQGATVTLAPLWAGQPVSLVFLSSLSGQLAIDNAVQWRDAQQHVTEAGGATVALCSATPAVAAAFREQWHLPFALLCDERGQAYRAFGVRDELPGSFVVDTEGVLTYAHRNKDALDYPATWELVDAIAAITGRTVAKPAPTPIGEERENAEMMEREDYRAPMPGSQAILNFTCAKCGYNDYEVLDVSATSGMMSRMVNLQNRRFSAVSCRRCKYTEFYKTESGALRNIFDLLVGT